ncbi:hypothetical protein C7M84_009557 [Penaeus vannamei]|uniref:Uncharacterized protein n=1 Tax=Penaeus vannamei TaxID=6689 RepID=A0A423T6D7_PENVA|nr:hypothetical protein C7M84_009557 [Penaeus vannamei]
MEHRWGGMERASGKLGRLGEKKRTGGKERNAKVGRNETHDGTGREERSAQVFERNAHAHVGRDGTQTDEQTLRGLKLNHRERRFIKFSSVEYQGQLYMTPQDFIESVTDSEPRPRLKRRVLTERDLERFMQETPLLSKGSPDMFRTIFDKGIISYTEYLFLFQSLTSEVPDSD